MESTLALFLKNTATQQSTYLSFSFECAKAGLSRLDCQTRSILFLALRDDPPSLVQQRSLEQHP
jgi:hypothetical protein